MRIGSLFSGYGGLERGVQSVLGGTVAWHCEIEKAPSRILAHQYPDVPNLGDITKVDWSQVEPVDVLTGGFPCQDVSHAGKRAGLGGDGARSGLWVEMAAAIAALRPGLVVIENVRGLLSARAERSPDAAPCELGPDYGDVGDEGERPLLRALGAVLGDLADLRYDAWWTTIRAADAGAPHGRARVFVFAWPAADAGCGDVSQQLHCGVARHGALSVRWDEGQHPPEYFHAAAVATADAPHFEHERGGLPRHGRPAPTDRRGHAAPDAPCDGRDERRAEPAGQLGGPHAAERGAVAPNSGRERHGRGEDAGAVGRVDREDAGRARERERAREVAEHRGGEAAADADERGRFRGREADGGHLGEHDPGHGGWGSQSAAGRGSIDWGAYAPAIHRWEAVLRRASPAPTEPGKRGQPRLSPRFVEWVMGLPSGWVTDVSGVSRNDQLKCLGNGVVPQQAALATRLFLAAQACEVAA